MCGAERGRALRDKVTHQIAFPIAYAELRLASEKESPVVRLSKTTTKPLDEFLDAVRDGVVANFLKLENELKSLHDSGTTPAI
ncbi:hypothetical protein ASF58_16280 [Methylobacterium sp. Leaf125]|nr:hypothetical protein ASF58_16280 [Methylobacterium sp. Leaf125]